ncbi:hypothetical protein PR202_ga06379 [Eleusine coracana subsp. coracana]|uniref:Pentatricopeptide repeat-containing protein n=1 Tax=Eleusine coracana subsp. coracana TaxID=191504 RepID=A0AAV5BYB2_ELECO|nr:hypothetical protein PR202_ga06379 [Eleusine coracana subsp. coracana]
MVFKTADSSGVVHSSSHTDISFSPQHLIESECLCFAESYMLAFAESGRKKDLIALLELLDLTKVSGSKYISNIFKSLGRLELESYAEKLLQGMKSKESTDGDISSLIFYYAANIPNMTVEDIVIAFHKWHEKFEVLPSIAAYDKIISICCNALQTRLALDVADRMCKSNSDVPIESFHPIIHACEQRCELDMFEGAYSILTDAEESGEISTTSLYNAIMLGYYREKNHNGAQMVMAQMQIAGVKPDSETFSYLIMNCESEENISKIMLDNEIPRKQRKEVKSALVAALASNGQVLEALTIYDQIKESGSSLEPKAAIALIEHIQTEGQLDRMYQLLEELIDSSSWFEGGSRTLLYCVQNNYLEAAIDLLKQLKEKDETSTYMVIDKVFGQIWDVEPTKLDLGMKLLHAIKDLGLNISRTSLDFLLSACVKAKDSQQAQKIWTEYESAGLPHNVLTSLRMYQALFSSGNRKAAKKLLKTIPKEDAHVRYIIESCHIQYYSEDFKLSATFRSSSKTKC